MEGVPLLAHSVVVHVVAGGVAAGWDHFQRLLAYEFGSLRLVLVDGGQGGLPAEAAEHLQHPLLGPLRRCHQGTAVSLQQVGIAGVAQDDAIGLVIQLAPVHDPDGRDEGAVVEDFGIGRPDAARARSAQVPEMSEGVAVGNQFLLEEHGRDEHHVRRVADAAPRDVGVVVPVHIPGVHGLRRVAVPDAAQYVAAQRLAVDFLSLPVEKADGVVLFFPNEGRHGRAFDEQLALQPRRAQGAANEL